MFKYSKMAGILSVVTGLLAVAPLIAAFILVPGLPDSVPMGVELSGEISRWGSKYELFIAPVLALAFGAGIYMQTSRKAAEHAKTSRSMAVTTAERFMRNAVLTCAAINIANIYLMYRVVTAMAV